MSDVNIPGEIQEAIENALEKANIGVTDDRVERIYATMPAEIYDAAKDYDWEHEEVADRISQLIIDDHHDQ